MNFVRFWSFDELSQTPSLIPVVNKATGPIWEWYIESWTCFCETNQVIFSFGTNENIFVFFDMHVFRVHISYDTFDVSIVMLRKDNRCYVRSRNWSGGGEVEHTLKLRTVTDHKSACYVWGEDRQPHSNESTSSDRGATYASLHNFSDNVTCCVIVGVLYLKPCLKFCY